MPAEADFARAPRGHAGVAAGLWRAAREERLPHALLFSGPPGCGKFQTARWFALGLLCARGPGAPCGVCGPCKRVRAGSHADLLTIDVVEEGRERLRIHRFAERPERDVPPEDKDKLSAERFLSLRPAEGGWRIVLVREVDRALEQAQNAVLKMLEEPAEGVLWILETAAPELLLPTILSRSVRVPFRALEAADVAALLLEAGVASEAARELARWSAGSVGRALELQRQNAAGVLAHVADLFAGRQQPVAAARRALAEPGEFSGATPRAAERSRARAVLDLAEAVLLDQLRRAEGRAPAELAHGDLELAEPAVWRVHGRALGEVLLRAHAALYANVQPEAVVELAFAELALPFAAARSRAGGAQSMLLCERP